MNKSLIILLFILLSCNKSSLEIRFDKVKTIEEEKELFLWVFENEIYELNYYDKYGNETPGDFENHQKIKVIRYSPNEGSPFIYQIKDWRNIHYVQ